LLHRPEGTWQPCGHQSGSRSARLSLWPRYWRVPHRRFPGRRCPGGLLPAPSGGRTTRCGSRGVADVPCLGREATSLEQLLGMDRDPRLLPTYLMSGPRSKWDAVQQGRHLAEEERLGLGIAPLTTVADLLATQGVRTAQVDLPEDISGLMLCEHRVLDAWVH